MLVISHRGHHPTLPENTLDAFEQASRLGVDGIETDVRLSRDGEPVLFHDRHAPGGRPVSSLSRDELEAAAGHGVPTLGEALEGFSNLLWVIEIKAPEAVPVILPILRRHRATTRCLVISFWHRSVLEVAAAVEVHGGFLLSHSPLGPTLETLARSRGPHVRAAVWNYEFLDRATVEHAAREGFFNLVYGVEGPDEHRLTVALGVDGIITDDPRLVLEGSDADRGAAGEAPR